MKSLNRLEVQADELRASFYAATHAWPLSTDLRGKNKVAYNSAADLTLSRYFLWDCRQEVGSAHLVAGMANCVCGKRKTVASG